MFTQLLAQRAAENRPIRVGIIGAGKFGAGLVAQISQMRGMTTAVIADINGERARNAYHVAGKVPLEALQLAASADAVDDHLRRGQPVVVEDGTLVAQSELVDVVV